MLRYAELRSVYEVMTRFHREGIKGMSKADRRVYRSILDLEYEENLRARAARQSE